MAFATGEFMKALVLVLAVLFSITAFTDDKPANDGSLKGKIKTGAQKVKSKTKELTVKASKKVRKTLEKMEENIED